MFRLQKKQTGFSSLLTATVLIALMGILMLKSSKLLINTQQDNQKNLQHQQAFSAAQAGLNYATAFVINQYNSVSFVNNIATLNPNTINQQLTDGSVSQLLLNNAPTGYDTTKHYVLIQSTGLSKDGNTQEIVQQIVKARANTANYSELDDTSRTGITVVNFNGGETIAQQNPFTLGANTLVANGPNSTGVVEDNTLYQADANSTTLFQNYFSNKTIETVRTQAQGTNSYYTNTSAHDYANELNGKTNQLIWIDQSSGESSIIGTGRVQIGTPENPVILVFDQSNNTSGVNLSGSDLTIYGVLYVRGSFAATSMNGINVIGSIVNDSITANSTTISGRATFAYNANIVDTVNNRFGASFPARTITVGHASSSLTLNATSTLVGNYSTLTNKVLGAQGVVPGSWKDFGLVPVS